MPLVVKFRSEILFTETFIKWGTIKILDLKRHFEKFVDEPIGRVLIIGTYVSDHLFCRFFRRASEYMSCAIEAARPGFRDRPFFYGLRRPIQNAMHKQTETSHACNL